MSASCNNGESSASIAALVAQARDVQQQRQGCANAFLDLPGLRQHCGLSTADQQWLESACERLTLSLRAAHRLLKVARTLADLGQASHINREHLAEALHYRSGN
ncbi:Competence protein ComM [compost metagenome]